MGNLLISEPPLQVLPSLAIALNSVDKAIILQQIHYWITRSSNVKDNYKWVYNSVSEWHKQFPWLSEKTVQRYLKDLENHGLLITGNYNKAKFDRTKWYRINYEALDSLGATWGRAVPTNRTDNPNSKGPGVITNTNRLPETTSETTKENSAAVAAPSSIESDFEEVWSAYPNKKGKKQAFNHYKYWRKKSAKHSNDYLFNQLKLYKQYIAQNKDWYRPMDGSTWFNGRFDDEYQVSTEPKHEGREYWTGG